MGTVRRGTVPGLLASQKLCNATSEIVNVSGTKRTFGAATGGAVMPRPKFKESFLFCDAISLGIRATWHDQLETSGAGGISLSHNYM